MRIRKLTPDGKISTIAGCGKPGTLDGPPSESEFKFVAGICVNNWKPDALLVADYVGNCIRAIDSSVVTTVAGVPGEGGHLDGPAKQALFMNPACVQVGPTGDIFVVDRGNHCIRRIDKEGLVVTTFAGARRPGFRDGVGAEAEFRFPTCLCIDADGVLWIADGQNYAIRRVGPDGTVTTIAGNGSCGFVDGFGAKARFSCPYGMILDGNDNLIVSDTENDCIRRVTPAGDVTTLLVPPHESPPTEAGARVLVCPCQKPAGLVLTDFSELVIAGYQCHQLFVVPGLPPHRDPVRRLLAQQLADSATADVVVVSGKQRLTAHRSVLASRSRYFAELLQDAVDTVPTRLAISDVLFPEMEAFLLFMYTSEVHAHKHAFGLLDLCQRFGVDDGCKRCMEYFQRNVSPLNAVEWLVQGHRRELFLLNSWLLQYVHQEWDAIRVAAPWTFNLMQPHPELLEATIPDHRRLRRHRLPAPKPAAQPSAV
eukprot:EG_transcript_7951